MAAEFVTDSFGVNLFRALRLMRVRLGTESVPLSCLEATFADLDLHLGRLLFRGRPQFIVVWARLQAISYMVEGLSDIEVNQLPYLCTI